MKYIDIKAADGSNIKISKIALGSAQYGLKVSKETAFDIMDRFIELGGNAIDTARSYGSEDDLVSFGLSEGIVADWIKSRGNRDKVVVMTKGAFPVLGTHREYVRNRCNPKEITEDFEKSWELFKPEPIDIYMLHRDDTSVPVKDIMDTLDGFVKSGRVRAIGASNWTLDRIVEANEYALQNGKTPFVVSEIQWSYPITDIDDPWCVFMNRNIYLDYKKRGIPIVCFSSQAGGSFINLYNEKTTWEQLPPFLNSEINHKKFAKLKEFCDRTGVSPATLGLSYITSNEVPGIPLVGPWTVAELENSLEGSDYTLTKEDFAWLDDVWDD